MGFDLHLSLSTCFLLLTTSSSRPSDLHLLSLSELPLDWLYLDASDNTQGRTGATSLPKAAPFVQLLP